MTKDGRIMDPIRGHCTTSEGQSYMMLQSIILEDKKTFDLVYKWCQHNIQRQDGLFSWLWGEHPNKEWKTIDPNSATDADTDIAFVLFLAYEKWKDPFYLHEAQRITSSIWNYETKEIDNHLVIMPGVNQAKSDTIEINPSYFSPYAYKIFQKYDTSHDWSRVVDSSYFYLTKLSQSSKTGLPPDWFYIENNNIVFKEGRSDFSYDAIRVFPRILLDYKITGDTRALPMLQKSKFFVEQEKDLGKIYPNVKLNGELKDQDEFVGSIALLVPTINLYDTDVAENIYDKQLKPYFAHKGYWDSKKDYYGLNLLWFGCYLREKLNKME